jgi:hypothetical protein
MNWQEFRIGDVPISFSRYRGINKDILILVNLCLKHREEDDSNILLGTFRLQTVRLNGIIEEKIAFIREQRPYISVPMHLITHWCLVEEPVMNLKPINKEVNKFDLLDLEE